MSTFTIRARDLVVDAASPVLPDAAVIITDGTIAEVGPWGSLDHPGALVSVDGVLSPGFVDAHSHLRGLPLKEHGVPARSFESWICSLGAVSALDTRDEALVAAGELLETGVTAVQGFVDADAGAEDALAGARGALAGVAASGIRGLVVLGFADRALLTPEPPVGRWVEVPPADLSISPDRVRELSREWLAQFSGRTTSLGIGPIGGQWSTDALLDAIAESAGTARLHTHLHESRLHRTWLADTPSPLDRLLSAGLMDDRMSCAHGVHLTTDDLDRIAAAGASLVHCPASNEALGVGRATVAAWLSRGIPGALGVDSQNTAAPDYFDVMRAALATASAVGDPLSARDVFSMATTGGSRAIGVPQGGRIAAGAPADIIELSLAAPTVHGIVESGSANAVRRAWVGGDLVVSDGHSLVDLGSARSRLRAQLDADAEARARRVLDLAPTVELIDELAGAMS
ncbi:cytosine/adenosine deaminase-related metal-dependent hydrolase [Leifsonia sp. AK011]|uniref:amidohydrolase family protein n=1 Tax=Leifsonia sp. AK011 TaxID=2723075 RepID=UPI0015C9455C|nr:amidohydrolase family protein [Leifsonia sp. AK011]NYF10867.1 cytosine/adenosine deaminase-related metal-dependent hydrolase [Leifsonia sp. AK011]